MRHVFPIDQVIHLWAAQSPDQTDARNSSNVHFTGPALYSYSTTIAAIIDGIAYISANSMSKTTGKHVSAARQATRHLQQFTTPAFSWSGSNPQLTHASLIIPAARQALDRLDDALTAPRTRKQTKLDAITAYMQQRERIQQHAARFNVTLPDMPEYLIDGTTLAEYQQRKEAARLEAEARAAERAELQRAEDAEQFNTWLTTGAGRCPNSYRRRSYYGATPAADGMTDYISIRTFSLTPETVQPSCCVITSQGAEAPLAHVIKALRFYDSRHCYMTNDDGTERYTPYHTNGHKIPLGAFTLDSIDEAGNVHAGCHSFTAAEIARFRQQWADVLQGEVTP
jgi:hypothetical protein